LEQHLHIILPSILLILSFSFKLLTDRRIKTADFITALCELPVDMMFLSISFIIAFTISSSKTGLIYWALYIFFAFWVVFFWRRSVRAYEAAPDRKGWLPWFAASFLIAILCLTFSISLLAPTSNSNPQKEKQELIEDKR